MNWVAIVLRVLVGLPFAGLGLMYFFVEMKPPEDLPEPAKQMMAALVPTGWMAVVKGLEIVGGLILLGGRYVPIGLILLVPVTVNIALWDALVLKYSMPPIGTVLLVLEIALIGLYWPHFAPLFRAKRATATGTV